MLEEVNSGTRQNAGVAQLVEREPSKLDVAGSSPVSRLCDARDRWWKGNVVLGPEGADW